MFWFGIALALIDIWAFSVFHNVGYLLLAALNLGAAALLQVIE